MVAAATPCAYALARLTFRGRAAVLAVTVAAMLIPPQVMAIPLFMVARDLGLINSLPGVATPACDAYIKRVGALPGERVMVNPRGEVRINGIRLSEPYVRNPCPVDAQGMGPCRTLNAVVPPGHVLVLGDNRANSWDGRFWPGGPFLPQQEIIGRAFWRFYPFNTAGRL